MKISDLTLNQSNVSVEGTIFKIGSTRSFSKFGKFMQVAEAFLKDDSGIIKLSLWNEDVARFKEGDMIRLTNGFIGEFQGERQLTTGKFGRIEKLNLDGN
jgi:replication factor A1